MADQIYFKASEINDHNRYVSGKQVRVNFNPYYLKDIKKMSTELGMSFSDTVNLIISRGLNSPD